MKFPKINVLSNCYYLLLITAFTLSVCGCAVDDKQLVETAKQYIEQNKLRAAAFELKNALQSNADNAEARYLLGQLNITIGDMASAAKEFRKAEQSGWDESLSQVGLMRARINSNDFKGVINDIQIKDSYQKSAQADLYGLKAFANAALGDTEKARASLALGEAIDANAFEVLKAKIQLELTQIDGVRAEASLALETALSLYKDNKEILLLSAFSALQAQDFALAAEQLRKIIALEPDKLVTFNGRSARLGLARIEIMNKNFEIVRDLLEPLFKQSANDPETNYISAMLAFEQGDMDLAEEHLLKVLKVVPEHAKSQLLFGTVNFAQKDYEQAAYYLGKYLKQEPTNIGVRKLLGRTYMAMGQSEDARSALKPGLQGEGESDAELHALVGLSQLQGGDTASGISDLKRAVEIAPQNQTLRSELAKAYISAGETQNAIKQLNDIRADGGDRDRTEVLMVSAYLRDQQYDRAINMALDILERSPSDPAVLALVGNVFAASGDREEARKYFTKAREINPDYVVATMLLAALEEAENNLVAAEALYRSIDSKKTTSIDHLLALARLSARQQKPESMLEWLEKARRVMSTDIRSRLILVEYYLQTNEIAKVEALAKEVIDIAPNDPRVLLLQGKVFMAQQRYNEALAPLNKLVTLESKSIVGRVLLGKIYLQLGQQQDARRQLDLALRINEFDIATLLLLTNLELNDGQLDKAITYCRKIQQIKPDLYIGYELEGDAYTKSKKYSKARSAYERAIGLQPSSALNMKISDTLVAMDMTVEAKQLLTDWLANHPDDLRVRQNLAALLQARGENAAAIDEYNRVLKLEPENVAALNNIAWLYTLDNNPMALQMAERAYEKAPGNPGIQDTYGWALVLNGKPEKGKQLLAQAIKLLPDDADVQYHYAAALAKSGEVAEARKRLVKLLDSKKPFIGIADAQVLLKSL